MSNVFIIKESERGALENAFKLNVRLFRSLPLFRKLFWLSALLIVLSSAAPSVVRWYSGNYASDHPSFSLQNLCWLIVCAILFRVGAWMSFEVSGMWAAKGIHADMVRALSHVRTTYFDENPSGRLINRLIRDFDEVRGTAIIFVGDLMNAGIEILSIAVVGSFASPFVFALLLPLFGSFFYIQYYRSSMLSHARRLSAIATSNVIARQTDLIEGREIFLLYGKSKRLVIQMAESLRVYSAASLLMSQVEAWGSFWIRFSAEIFSFFVLLFLIYAISNHHVDSALVGVIISSLFGITGSIGWLDFATSLVSRSVPHLERVFEIMDLPDEASEELKEPIKKDSKGKGEFLFEHYSMSYRKDSPLILKNLNLSLHLGKKSALIGRTGSGKSSLIQAIFRMVYVHAGNIYLDGESIYTSSPRDHRKRFAMIPQSPYLFEGTIRSNLDPFHEVSENDLRSALRAVELALSLEHAILEEGKNLSQGERQLICLARAIAMKKELIIMDEATSGLDPETDANIHQVLKREFSGKTVITIAHRLDTIRDYDWVVELEQGQVIRQGMPSLFLKSACNPVP